MPSLNPKKVLVSSSAIRSGRSGDEVARYLGLNSENLLVIDSLEWLEIAKNFRPDILWCHFDWEIGRDEVQSLHFLTALATTSTGVTHLDIGSLAQAGVKLVRLESTDEGLSSITSTADLTFALITGLQTGLFSSLASSTSPANVLTFTREKQIQSTVLGVIGLGRIGFKVAEILESMGAMVIYHDLDLDVIDVVSRSKPNWQLANIGEILASADIVSIHAAEQGDGRPILLGSHFDQAKTDLKIVNTARSSLVDIECLVNFLEANQKSGYATDFEPCPQFFGMPDFRERLKALKQEGRFIVSPHIGGASREAADRAELIIMRKLQKVISGARQE